MTNEEYIECILKMLRNLNNRALKKIYRFVQRIFI